MAMFLFLFITSLSVIVPSYGYKWGTAVKCWRPGMSPGQAQPPIVTGVEKSYFSWFSIKFGMIRYCEIDCFKGELVGSQLPFPDRIQSFVRKYCLIGFTHCECWPGGDGIKYKGDVWARGWCGGRPDARRILADQNYTNVTESEFRMSFPDTSRCFDNEVCGQMLVDYEGSDPYQFCAGFEGCNDEVFELFTKASRENEPDFDPGECSCEGYNGPDIGKLCENDEDCPSCLQCCPKRKICEIPPAKSMLFQHDINDINDNDFVEPEIGEKKRIYEYPIFGYISFVGIIVFILINNVFIGYWCCCKSHGNKNKYEKCDMI